MPEQSRGSNTIMLSIREYVNLFDDIVKRVEIDCFVCAYVSAQAHDYIYGEKITALPTSIRGSCNKVSK